MAAGGAGAAVGPPIIGFVHSGSASGSAGLAAAFRKGLGEVSYVDGQNVRVEYHWLEGQYDRLPTVMADLVRRCVAVIASVGVVIASAAKAATATVPIVFGVAEDPVKLGLVASLSRPGGNATGINFYVGEVLSKRLELFHELVPKAVRVAALVNPAVATTSELTSREAREASRSIGLRIGKAVGLRLYPDIEARLDAWIVQQKESGLGRPEAIRRILDKALPAFNAAKTPRKKRGTE
jgi:putative tryptophan/tyrosine transport system substrate-binding protein